MRQGRKQNEVGMFTLGIDVGASSLKLVALDESGELLLTRRVVHEGSPRAYTKSTLELLAQKLPFEECAGIAATGSGASVLQSLAPTLCLLEDVPAATMGAEVLAPQAQSIMCIGGQSTLFVTAPEQASDTHKAAANPWQKGAPHFATNDSCAAGTGSFFEDQMERLGMEIEDYSKLVEKSQTIPRLSGRCTVFAKTDIIHRQQEGVPVEDILQGLCHAMVKNFKTTIVRGLAWKPPLILAGGVVLNSGVVRAVKDVFKLTDDELIATPDMVFLQAAGAALYAQRNPDKTALSPAALVASLQETAHAEKLPRNERLPQIAYNPGLGYPDSHLLTPEKLATLDAPISCSLGVDVGSTSTNLVLIDMEGNLLDAQYLRTRGNPREVVKEGLASIGERLGDAVRIVSAGTTGSGRVMIGDMIGADVVRDEITAQARAATAADPAVDTVFEIGGQDSKFIHLKDGQVNDFQMNKVCAAGTGSFVEEQAARLGIPLDEYGDLALGAKHPVDLGERCTVFVETAIHTALAKGASLEDVAAGLCQSIVRNYLHRVVAGKTVGNHIVLQGGVNYNPGIVAAFKQFYGDKVTVSPWFAVSGAVGVALLALESARAAEGVAGTTQTPELPSSFRGFHLERTDVVDKRNVDPKEVAANKAYFNKVNEFYLKGYDPTRDPNKKTVGIPRSLMMFKFFPMANAFFRALGYNVILTDETSEDTIRLSQQTAQGEVCYPVKLIHGHMKQLLDQKVDYIFFPRMHTIRHIKSKSPHNYACVYMQTAPTFVAKELKFEERGVTLLSPVFELDFGQDALAKALLGVGAQLGHSPRDTARAMIAGGAAVNEFSKRTEDLGEELLNSIGPDERVIVLITRQYGVMDSALNMGIPEVLLERGQKVITLSHLPAHDIDISADYPGVYWPFGQHIISGAKLIRRDPRLFAVYLTNHGCGPDTMISHYFREEMGDKPYLQIETDEHFSKVGVITRVEAFLNAIEHYTAPDERNLPLSTHKPDGAKEKLHAHETAAMPEIGLYGTLLAHYLQDTTGVTPQLIAPTQEIITAGQEETETKEYLTFTAFLGTALKAAELGGADKQPVQLLLPSTEGTEADGQYDRVIRTILDERHDSHVRIIAPKLEQLPWTLADPEGFFAAILAADVCYAAPRSYRQALVTSLTEGSLTLERVEKAAAKVASLEFADETALSVVGEWPLVYSDELTAGILARLEEQGIQLKRMPFSEYLLFLWADAVEADQHERNNTPFMLDAVSARATMPVPGAQTQSAQAAATPRRADTPAHPEDATLPNFALPTEEKQAVLAKFEQAMTRVSAALGNKSAFADSLKELQAAATRVVGPYRGGNGRYRAAKALVPPCGVKGTLACASMYENTEVMLKLMEATLSLPVPALHVGFDGVLDKTTESKVRSFLYYLS